VAARTRCTIALVVVGTLLVTGVDGAESEETPPQAKAALNTEQLSNTTIEMTRGSLHQARLDLRETTGNQTVVDLAVTPVAVFVKESKTLAPGEVTVKGPRPASPASGEPTEQKPPAKFSIPAGGHAQLSLTFFGFQQTGEFETRLYLSSASLSETQVIPLNVRVTDPVWIPLLVILLGVAGGGAVKHFAERRRPQLQQEIRLIRVRDGLRTLQSRTNEPQKLHELREAELLLTAAEQAITSGRLDEAASQLDQAAEKLEAFRAGEAARLKEVRDLLSETERQFEGIKGGLVDSTRIGTVSFLAAWERTNSEILSLLRTFHVDTAARLLDKLRRDFATAVGGEIDDIRGKLPSGAPGDAIRTKLGEARRLLDEFKFAESMSKLREAKQALRTAKAQAQGARPTAIPRFLDAVREPVDAPRILVVSPTDPTQVTTGISTTFQLHLPAGVVGDRIKWQFSDGSESHVDGVDSLQSHRFRQHGAYTVVAHVYSGQEQNPKLSVSTEIQVLRGRAEQGIELKQSQVQSIDFGLSLIAAVLAGLTGLLYLYVDKAFGSPSDYMLALLWGFGIDNSVRGFSDVLKKITAAS